MPKTTLFGHPLHPQLIAFPLGLLPFSGMMDAVYLATRKRSYADAAYYSMVAGYAGAAIAGLAGLPDYLAIPDKTQVKRTANTHVILNIAVTSLYTVNLASRTSNRRPGVIQALMSLVGFAGLFASSWFGGHMVYHQGMRVKGVSPIASEPDLKLPGDEKGEATFQQSEEAFPRQGVMLQTR